jgi:hypothetical protein
MQKETLEQLKTDLEALKLPDVTVAEIITLVTEPLAHLEVKSADGGRLHIWTQAAVFTVDLAACRIGVAAELTAGLHQARKKIDAALKADKPKRGRRVKREQVEDMREEELDAAPEIIESLGKEETAAPSEADEDEGDNVEEVVTA